MLRTSSTSPSRALLLFVLLLGGATPAAARLCLPPLFEAGQRLHPRGGNRLYWLELMLRQHEVCWREPGVPEEKRVFLTGSSGIYGHPLPAAQTLGEHLNRRFARDGVAARFFNLGHVFTYQVKDALVIREALPYAPDVIVYGVTLDDFRHLAPMPHPQLWLLFRHNRRALADFTRERPAGLEEPMEANRSALEEASSPLAEAFGWLQEIGRLVRISAREHARWLQRSGTLPPAWAPPAATASTAGRQLHYDCDGVTASFAELFRDWKQWNILAYLEEVSMTTGAEIVVVNWPVAFEPVGDCYNVRYPRDGFEDFTNWLGEEAARRGFRYVDLHDALPSTDFFDSLHPTPRGQRKIAFRLQRELRPLLQKTTEEIRRPDPGA